MKPLHRIINYDVLLKEVFRCAEQASLYDQLDALQHAINSVAKFRHAVNNVMILNKLYNFNVRDVMVFPPFPPPPESRVPSGVAVVTASRFSLVSGRH